LKLVRFVELTITKAVITSAKTNPNTEVPGVEPAEYPTNLPLVCVEASASPNMDRAELCVHKKRMLYCFNLDELVTVCCV